MQILYRIVFQLEDIIQFAEIFQLFNDSKRDKGRKTLPIRRALFGTSVAAWRVYKESHLPQSNPICPGGAFLELVADRLDDLRLLTR